MPTAAAPAPIRPARPGHSRSFETRLRETRIGLGWSQADLAEAAGLQQSALSHYENGVRRPSFTNLRRLAAALGVSTDFLVGHAPPVAPARSADDAALLAQIRRLRPADRRVVRDLVTSLLDRSE